MRKSSINISQRKTIVDEETTFCNVFRKTSEKVWEDRLVFSFSLIYKNVLHAKLLLKVSIYQENLLTPQPPSNDSIISCAADKT